MVGSARIELPYENLRGAEAPVANLCRASARVVSDWTFVVAHPRWELIER
jgi:hypothetical protein